jgi:replication-associated recombination protein RarA
MAFHLTTATNYDFYEVASALQKEIRRGDEEAALYWALELTPKYDTFLWRRLAIMASEDIGPADNTMAGLIDVLAVNYRDVQQASARPQERIILAHAIIALCRAKKSRVADDLACLVSHQREHEGLRREIPDYALDQHTRRGQAQGRGWDHWAEEGCRLSHEVKGLNRYRDRALALRQQYGRLAPRAPRQGRRQTGEQPPLFEEDG